MSGTNMIDPTSLAPAGAVQAREHVNLIQHVMKAVMKPEVHFGTIPGTEKPSLLKPGAEVLCATFHIAPRYRVEDLSTPDVARYRVTCEGVHQPTGTVLGEGMGSCSSGEEKYKWRRATSPKEFEATSPDRRRVKHGYNKRERETYEVQQVRTEPADLDNTVLKMACKRAQVAMTLNVTAASDIFTQDVEDLPDELRGLHEEDQKRDTDERRERLLKQVSEAKSTEELTSIWKSGLKECMEAQDRETADAFKAAVKARTEALKAPAQPAEEAPAPQPEGAPA